MSRKVLVGCETSGVVRRAFLARGFDAWSCDLLPCDDQSNRHIVGDVRDVLDADSWDLLMVAHPPCTRLCNSGVRWLSVPPAGKSLTQMWAELDEGATLFGDLLNADVPHLAVENPVMHRHAKERISGFFPATQSVQPWQFADRDDSPDNVKKRTCLWLRNLPCLVPTGTQDGATARPDIHHATPGPDRWRRRSKFFPGMAEAMATQWGGAIA